MATKDVTDLMVCEAYDDWRRNVVTSTDDNWPYSILMKRTGEPFKVCYAACERACDRDLIEFGVSLRTGWLTDKGKALLASAPRADGKA